MKVDHLALDDRPHSQPLPPGSTCQDTLRGALCARVPHQLEELVLAADMSVQRHRGEAELVRDARHRDCAETLGVGDSDSGFDDSADGQIQLWAPRAPAE